MPLLPSCIPDKGDLQNKVDKDVQSLLFPLNLMQTLVLHPKYQIKSDFIIPNNRVNKCIALCATLFFMSTHYYNLITVLLDNNITRYQPIPFLHFASIFDVVFVSAGCIMNYITFFLQTKQNVKFVLTFQELHRFLNKNNSCRSFVIISWINVALIIGFFIVCTIYEDIKLLHPPWYTLFHLIFILILDCDSIYAIRLMRLLTDELDMWKIQVLNSVEDEDNEVYCEGMFKAYTQILKCYKIVQKHFQLTTFFKTAECFFHELVNCQILIDFSKIILNVHGPHFVQGLLYAWLVKDMAVQIALSLQLEEFYRTVEKTQDSCAIVLASNCTAEEKRLCKNALRLHRASFSKMSVFGMFYIDVCHPIRLIVLLTNYTVVLLQFAFL